ncbi:BTAD domain-containing putative transcriptional regulator [Actinomadura rupiterrae]|uniref:BTAD domain-containing putative transcriptional regulator n=1 Tax=Actinomadura rupiterrae TaxID=559627 RepID=UPI0020A4D3CA|nr:BTAD domain-containing putative transcriptional regulator [Actinomadura rupiterrae]MCP2343750.1 putative ATPase/DNA-binding SARP family transcriptional activator [Actinomadura rupiterrae]
MAGARIGILGPLEARDASGRPVEISGPRLRALLIRLALEPGRPVSAARLLDDLWDGAPPGGNALQALVSRLRALTGRDLIEHGPAGYRLALDPASVDAVAFERAVAAARTLTSSSERAVALRQALDMWRGPALADVADADFAHARATRLEELRLTASEDRMEAELALGESGSLLPELEAMAAAHPLRERVRCLLMQALNAAGRPADALRVYEETREHLAEHLGVDPAPELAALHLSILRRDAPEPAAKPQVEPAEPARPAPAPAAPERRTNLSAGLTSFVGRDEEVRQLGKMLAESRLVTLTGPGGAGKTRLASEAAAPLVDRLPDGVWFIPLAPMASGGSGDAVAQAVLVALEVPDLLRPAEGRTAPPPLDRLADLLATRRTLLVLDNCEHVLDGVAAAADRVLAAAPEARVLATSREPIGITGETLYPVPSLSLPPVGADPATALEHAATRLLADRAAAVRPGFAVDEANVADLVEIVRALDGIPLAIELAAARLRALTPAQVAARLGDRFRLLTGGSRAALPRHRTLRAVVDWSWDLLDDDERRVLRRLSVFAGGATLEAVERVCATDPPAFGAGASSGSGSADEFIDVVDVVASLVDKSLVMADGDAEPRYRLLETVRVYARERLDESGETGAVRAAHAAYYLELAERAEPELRRNEQLLWVERLTAERENHNAAFQTVIEAGDVVTGLRLVTALVWYWLMRDLEREACRWAAAVHELAGDEPPPGLSEQYAICAFTGSVVARSGEHGPAPELFGETISDLLRFLPERPRHPMAVIARPASQLFLHEVERATESFGELTGHPDPWIRAIATTMLIFSSLHDGDVDGAYERARGSYEGFRDLGDRLGMGITLIVLVQISMSQGRPEEALRYGEEARRYAAQGVNPDQGSILLIQLARARAELGDTERAYRDLAEGVRAAVRIGEYADATTGYITEAEFHMRDGDLAAAREAVDQAMKLAEPRMARADFHSAGPLTYSKLGTLYALEGDLVRAAEWHTRALRSIEPKAMLVSQTIAAVVEGVAGLAMARGEHERAAELLGTAHSVLGFRDKQGYDRRRVMDAILPVLGQDAFDAAYERGRAATAEDALALTP